MRSSSVTSPFHVDSTEQRVRELIAWYLFIASTIVLYGFSASPLIFAPLFMILYCVCDIEWKLLVAGAISGGLSAYLGHINERPNVAFYSFVVSSVCSITAFLGILYIALTKQSIKCDPAKATEQCTRWQDLYGWNEEYRRLRYTMLVYGKTEDQLEAEYNEQMMNYLRIIIILGNLSIGYAILGLHGVAYANSLTIGVMFPIPKFTLPGIGFVRRRVWFCSWSLGILATAALIYLDHPIPALLILISWLLGILIAAALKAFIYRDLSLEDADSFTSVISK